MRNAIELLTELKAKSGAEKAAALCHLIDAVNPKTLLWPAQMEFVDNCLEFLDTRSPIEKALRIAVYINTCNL